MDYTKARPFHERAFLSRARWWWKMQQCAYVKGCSQLGLSCGFPYTRCPYDARGHMVVPYPNREVRS